jgi:uncharacterized protein (TIGR03435 family)
MKNYSALFYSFAFASLLIAGLLCGRCTLAAQTAPAKPAFDVATIKRSPPIDPAKLSAEVRAGKMPRFGPHVTASRAEYVNMPLKDLVANAFKVRPYQVSGPDWLATERFDIEATLPEGASKNDAPAMLRALLAERFKLTSHRDTQEHKVLALIVGKGAPRLKRSTTVPQPVDENAPLKPGEMVMDGPDGPIRMAVNHDGSVKFDLGAKGTLTEKLDAQNQAVRLDSDMVTMEGFAETLSQILAQMGGNQVVDMTGLKGAYEFSVEISLADIMAMAQLQGFGPPPTPQGNGAAGNAGQATASDPAGGSSIFMSVQQMGLKLEERKAMVTQLVVDHVEKMPTEN